MAGAQEGGPARRPFIGLSLRGLGRELMLIVNEVAPAALVLAEAFATNRAELLKGQRKELMG